jgi:hypothetical protein
METSALAGILASAAVKSPHQRGLRIDDPDQLNSRASTMARNGEDLPGR